MGLPAKRSDFGSISSSHKSQRSVLGEESKQGYQQCYQVFEGFREFSTIDYRKDNRPINKNIVDHLKPNKGRFLSLRNSLEYDTIGKEELRSSFLERLNSAPRSIDSYESGEYSSGVK